MLWSVSVPGQHLGLHQAGGTAGTESCHRGSEAMPCSTNPRFSLVYTLLSQHTAHRSSCFTFSPLLVPATLQVHSHLWAERAIFSEPRSVPHAVLEPCLMEAKKIETGLWLGSGDDFREIGIA